MSITYTIENPSGSLYYATATHSDGRAVETLLSNDCPKITVTNEEYATFEALLGSASNELGQESNNSPCTFKVAGTGDTTDNALQTAKGSAPAADDVFFWAPGFGLKFVANLP